jgi:hypothetical protein
VTLSLEKQLEITRDILRLAQGMSANLAQVEAILLAFDLPPDDYEARIFVLTRIIEIMRELSVKTFRNGEHRLEVIEAIQNCMDRYIEEEDVVISEVSQ